MVFQEKALHSVSVLGRRSEVVPEAAFGRILLWRAMFLLIGCHGQTRLTLPTYTRHPQNEFEGGTRRPKDGESDFAYCAVSSGHRT